MLDVPEDGGHELWLGDAQRLQVLLGREGPGILGGLLEGNGQLLGQLAGDGEAYRVVGPPLLEQLVVNPEVGLLIAAGG